MNNLNQQLQTAFMFQPTDLRFNRTGKLSQRQKVRLRAGRGSMLMSLFVFISVMLGTFGFILFMQHPFGKDYHRDISSQVAERVTSEQWASVIILAVVIGAIIIASIVWFLIQRARTATHQISVAKGKAEIVSNDQASYNVKIKIGETILRLMTLDQLEAFSPGIEYRVFYLAGPRPTILSAEVVGSEKDDVIPDEKHEEAEQSIFMQMQKRGRVIVIMVGLLAIAIPFIGVAASKLTKGWRTLAWIALFAIAIGFVPFALRWLSSCDAKKN